MSVYTDNGYENREQYLKQLAEEYDIPLESVETMADVLGPTEDFDGLVVFCQDAHALGHGSF